MNKRVTKRGVYLDLSITPFILKHNEKVFRFSSRTKLLKYTKEITILKVRLENNLKSIFNKDYKHILNTVAVLVDLLYLITYNNLKHK